MGASKSARIEIFSLFACLTEEDKNAEVVDESDKELIRVARGDVEEDEEPQEKSHKEKKRSTEGKTGCHHFYLERKLYFKTLILLLPPLAKKDFFDDILKCEKLLSKTVLFL